MSGILSPAFLQAAGRAGKEKFSGIKLFTLATDPKINSITGTDIVVTSIKNGEKQVETYGDLESDTLAIEADKNTEIIITGTITECEIGGNTIYSRISVKNTALTSLDCSDCYALQELNLSTNTALTSLNCNSCTGLKEIRYPATDSNVSAKIASAITAATAADGTVYTDSAADYYSTIETAAIAKGWTIEQL